MLHKQFYFSVLIGIICSFSLAAAVPAGQLSRGMIALRTAPDTVIISWRSLQSDPEGIGFDVYRTINQGAKVKLNKQPLTGSTHFTDSEAAVSGDLLYTVEAISGPTNTRQFATGIGSAQWSLSDNYLVKADSHLGNYLTIPVQPLENHSIGDGSAADLDGDGDLEIIIKREMRPRDNSHRGITGQTKIEAYKLDGTFLWRIDLGRNIREGAHYTQFLVYDFDGDGRAELACKTSDGTIDGTGKVIGDPTADHRNEMGHISKGPEFLTIFDGLTGAALTTVDYIPQRHPQTTEPSPLQMKDVWGDGNYNRSERYLACVAYLDGVKPSLVMCRGYYTRSVLAAWDFDGKQLIHRWTFDSDDTIPGNRAYRGQGNHNISVADVDGDGCDEIIYGAACINNDGTGLYSTRLHHGDALHVSDLDPERPGLEVWMGHETQSDIAGIEFRDARTGELIWSLPSQGDVGRSLAADIDPRHPGYECWAFGPGISGLYSAKGKKISEKTPITCNFRIFWDGDLQHELLDRNYIAKYDWEGDSLKFLLRAHDCRWNNGSKATPVLSGDLLGDWREEVIWRTADNTALRIYTTPHPTEHRMVSLLQDRQYRLAVAWQNVGYNQPPSTSFYPAGIENN
jgi:rhamnogalacturonan endolyase